MAPFQYHHNQPSLTPAFMTDIEIGPKMLLLCYISIALQLTLFLALYLVAIFKLYIKQFNNDAAIQRPHLFPERIWLWFSSRTQAVAVLAYGFAKGGLLLLVSPYVFWDAHGREGEDVAIVVTVLVTVAVTLVLDATAYSTRADTYTKENSLSRAGMRRD